MLKFFLPHFPIPIPTTAQKGDRKFLQIRLVCLTFFPLSCCGKEHIHAPKRQGGFLSWSLFFSPTKRIDQSDQMNQFNRSDQSEKNQTSPTKPNTRAIGMGTPVKAFSTPRRISGRSSCFPMPISRSLPVVEDRLS